MKLCKKTIGLIVNPIAGMGGAVGLKGTDSNEILARAIALGAKPVAPPRTEAFLKQLKNLGLDEEIDLLVGAGLMGEEEAKRVDFKHRVIGLRKEKTSADDTKIIAKEMVRLDAKIIVFCGGDGTARDLMDAIGMKAPVLGIPSGVKMHSAVFAVNPEAAANILARFIREGLPLREAEVMDVDEEAFREGRLSARLYGYMLIPYEPELIQGTKVASLTTDDELRNKAAIATYVIDRILEPNTIYILGPGTTVRTITDLLDEKKTLLGVDLLLNGRIIAHDVNEKKILEMIRGKKSKIIVTPIGGQGFIFGRGNQQISAKVIEEVGIENIVVIATKHKLRGLRKLRVDTGNPDLDRRLRGYMRVIVDYGEEMVMPVE
ncbi:ATP-NAD kinase family protein [Candidatus Bathyarchaeota archaeon]|nr:ATP-NAD kinase family protein [Candidatus Bathyarchaeota archaeon]